MAQSAALVDYSQRVTEPAVPAPEDYKPQRAPSPLIDRSVPPPQPRCKDFVYAEPHESSRAPQCLLSQRPVVDPLQCSQGHLSCRTCSEENGDRCTEQECKAPLQGEAALFVRNILDKLQVICPECRVLTVRGGLDEHRERVCPQASVSCAECGWEGRRSDEALHRGSCSQMAKSRQQEREMAELAATVQQLRQSDGEQTRQVAEMMDRQREIMRRFPCVPNNCRPATTP